MTTVTGEEAKGISRAEAVKRAKAAIAKRKAARDDDRDVTPKKPPPPPPPPPPEPVPEPEPPKPPPPPEPIVKPPTRGRPTSVLETTGDKYIVRTQLAGKPKGEYLQETLTKSEIEARGGFVPPSGVKVSEVEAFAEKHGMSDKSAADTLTRFQRDPTRPEFAALATEDKESLLKTAPPKVDVELVEMVEGQPKLFVETAALRKLAGIKDPEERFHAMQALRLIPKEEKWVDPVMYDKALKALVSYKKPDGTYDWLKAIDDEVTPGYLDIMFGKKAVAEVKASIVGFFRLPDGNWVEKKWWNTLLPKYQTIGMREGLPVMEKALDVDAKDWEKRHIELKDGKWMLISDWNEIPAEFQKVGLRMGYTAMDRALDTHYKIQKRNYDAAIKAMEPYKTVTGRPGAEDIAYDLYAARQEGVPKPHIITLFGEVTLKEVEQQLREKAEVIPSYDNIAIEELEKAVREHGDMWRYKGQLITDGERKDVIKAYERLPYKTRMMVVHPSDEMTKEQPALVLAADKKWQELKGRPKLDPERQAYLVEWQKKLLDTIALAGTFVAPFTWGLVGRVGTALTPARIAATPIIKYIPKIATALAQITFTGAPIAYTGATINESLLESDLQRKWEIFSNVEPKLQDGYAKVAGYDKPFKALTDAEKAVVLIHYTVPRDYTLSQWSRTLAEHTEKLIEYAGKGSAWVQEKYPHAGVTVPVSFAGGAVIGVMEGISYTAQLPMIAANLVAKVPEGDPKAFAAEVAEGFVAFFTTVLPAAIRADPALAAGRITGLFLLAPASVVKLAQGAKARISPRYVAERAMGQEITTMRVELIAGDLAKLTKAQRLKVGEELTAQLLAGEKTARLKIGGTTWVAEVSNVPMQIVKKNIGYHFTPDITKFDPAKGTGTLFLSPQAARQAGLASLVAGERMKHPGLIEVHLPEGYSPKIGKLLGKNKVELEIPLKDRIYDPIPGSYGKGVSSNVQMGAYPIRRFVIRGSAIEGVPLTVKQWAQVRALTLKEATLDAVAGWHGRKVALKAKLGKDPRIKKVNESIKSLENEVPELVDAKGNIIRQRTPVDHPTKPGLMHNRVTAVMFDKPQGRVLLVRTANDPGFWSLPGGRAGAKPGLFPYRGKRTGKEITFAEASAGQTQMETGIVWTGSSKYRGIYLGKINEYSLSGSRVYELRAKNTNINIRKHGDTELVDAFWWDGKSPAKGNYPLSPAIHHILKPYPHLNLALVKIFKESPLLNKAIDKGYINRVKKGEFISEADIARINKVELQRLKAARKKLIKGEPLGFGEWLTAENDFATIAELLHGRRRATRVIHDGVVSKSELQMLFLHPELITKKAWTILRKTLEKKKLSPEEIKLLEREFTKAFEGEKAKFQDAFDRAYEASYRENRAYFDRRYAALYGQIAARVAGIRRVAPERREEVIDRYVATYRAVRPERSYRPEARRLPVTYGKPYLSIRQLTRYEPTIYKPLEYKPAVRPEPVRPEPVRPEPVRPEPIRPEPVRPEPVRPEPVRPEPIKPEIVVVTRLQMRSPISQPIPGGSIAWALGERKGVRGLLVPNWFFIPPPFDQPKPISLSAPPIGARNAGSVSPYETIQVIGRSRRGVPRRVDVDLGWADIEVINGKEIHFKGGGLETDVGTRMPSPTRGMDLGEGGFTGVPISKQEVSRPRMPKKKPSRRKPRLSHWDYMTTLKGFRP